MSDRDHSEEIDRLLDRAERDPRTHTFARLADLYRKSGELDRALDVVETGLRHHPHYLNARIVHARVLRDLGRHAEAREAFERVLRIDSENLVAREALSELGAAGRPAGVREREPRRSQGWLARLDADWRSANAEDVSHGPASAEGEKEETDGASSERDGSGDAGAALDG
ncbi:MAG: tetratricopeptide repeat protein, partial [Gemmatimonadota bacterium]|nr:tetratricopeptide repeat protein [Gemmatimonadota bacterium]